MRTLFLVATLAVLLPACARTARPPGPEADPERARAALATLFVQNETGSRLDIFYLAATGGASRVGVGPVEPGATAEMAPVPAAEPLALIARNPAGAELMLPPRTFAIDGRWTWRIPADARFVTPSDR